MGWEWGSRRRFACSGELGAATLSTDAVVHELLVADELRDLVSGRLGPDVVRTGHWTGRP